MKNMLMVFLVFFVTCPVFAAEVINSGATNPVAPYGDYINFGSKIGSPGYGFRTNAGTIEFKNLAGNWVAVGGGTGDVVGPAASVDSEIAIYNSTTGKLLKRFAGTGILTATTGVIGTATTTGTGAIALAGSPVFTTQISTPSVVSSGALGITPASGSNLNVNLAGTGDFAVNTSQFYVDTSTGYVGVGTSTPVLPVHLVRSGVATARIESTDNTTASYASVGLKNTGSHTFDMMAHAPARTGVRCGIVLGGWSEFLVGASGGGSPNGMLFSTVSSIPIVFGTNGFERMRITGDGNIVVGTTTAVHKMSLSGAFGVYESVTDSSNYSALKLSADSGGYKFTADQLGTGIANRPFVFLQTSSATGKGWDFQTGTGTSKFSVDVAGKPSFGTVTDSTASPGNATLNTVSGKSAIAAAASACTITNSNVTASSLIFVTPLDNDATLLTYKAVAASGSFVVTGNSTATATWKFQWFVIN